jgi:hypothetical protein
MGWSAVQVSVVRKKQERNITNIYRSGTTDGIEYLEATDRLSITPHTLALPLV